MNLTLTLLLAVLLDYQLGEPANRYHPLVAYGRWVNWLEQRLLNTGQSAHRQKLAGILAWLLAMLPCVIWLLWQPQSQPAQIAWAVLTLYFCIGARSLQQHAQAVQQSLQANDLPLSRQRVAMIVSRQTDKLSATDVRRATIESVLENGADALFAPLFWFIILGPFGAVMYRLSNTLDAMWGYKNQRYQAFGWSSARFDDVLNWAPARLTAISYALLGNTRIALHAWRQQANLLDSPNAGPVMTAGAGSLNLQLGGPAWYHGQIKNKPWFGGDKMPVDTDIDKAWHLVYQTLGIWLVLISFGGNIA